MSPRKTILAAALLILLGLYIYLFEFKEDGERLFPFHVDDVQALALDYQDQKIRMSKGPAGEWVLNVIHVKGKDHLSHGALCRRDQTSQEAS